jgi:hypothetical protein
MGSGRKKESEIEQKFVRDFTEGRALKLYETHWPDRLIILPNGRTGFIEFKTPEGRLSPGQKIILNWLVIHGHKCLVATSADEALEWTKWLNQQ